MKLFVAFLPLVIALASSEPAIDAKAIRDGRILATYERQTSENTAKALPKLSAINSLLGTIGADISSLTATHQGYGNEIAALFGDVKAALRDGSDLVSAFKDGYKAADDIYDAVYTPSPTSFVSYMQNITELIDVRLAKIEKFLGFDEVHSGEHGHGHGHGHEHGHGHGHGHEHGHNHEN